MVFDDKKHFAFIINTDRNKTLRILKYLNKLQSWAQELC